MLQLVKPASVPHPDAAHHVNDNIKFLRAVERIAECAAWLTERGYRIVGSRIGGINGPVIRIAPHSRAFRELGGYQTKWERAHSPYRDVFEATRHGIRIQWEMPA